MMDLTPLDVRKKKGDFRRGLRGYEAAQVDDFLDLTADRMEVLVREAASAVERIARLEQQVADYRDREKALTEALVTAQQMREDIRTQSTREVELLRRQAEQDAERIRAEAVRMREREEGALDGLRSRQFQFIASYRKYLEQELAELGATMQSLEMHKTGTGKTTGSGPVAPPSAPDAPTSFRPAAPAAAGTIASAPVSAPVQPPAPPVQESSPPTAPPVAVVPVEPVTDPIEAEEPLEEALARWEPELEAAAPTAGDPESGNDPVEDTASEESVTAAVEEETGDAFDPDDGAIGSDDDLLFEAVPEADEGDDLLLSADDVVADEAPDEAGDVVVPEAEVADDLDFLELGEDDIAPSEPLSAEVREARAQEVNAAMVDADDSFIDLEKALHEEPVVMVTPADVPAGPERDETDDMIDAAFDFGEDDLPAGDPPTIEEPVSGPPAGQPVEAVSDLEEDIEFVDALLLDAETAFNEVPAALPSEDPIAGTDASTDDADAARGPAAEFGSDGDSDVDAAFGDDSGAAEPGSDGAEEGSNLIDLDSFRGFSRYNPPASPTSDVSSLTLHPMFFEQDPTEKESEEHEETRQDH